MRAQITSFKQQQSKYGDTFFYVFFKDQNGKSFRSCIYQNMRNFAKWKNVLKNGMVLDNLTLKDKGLIDADSQFHIIGVKDYTLLYKKPETQPQPKVIQKKLF